MRMSISPDRWLENSKAPDGKQLSRYMVSFGKAHPVGTSFDSCNNRCVATLGKGSRSCTGMQLAYAEMYIALATFFRSPVGSKARLYETDRSDVAYTRDRFVPKPRLESQGVRITLE